MADKDEAEVAPLVGSDSRRSGPKPARAAFAAAAACLAVAAVWLVATASPKPERPRLRPSAATQEYPELEQQQQRLAKQQQQYQQQQQLHQLQQQPFQDEQEWPLGAQREQLLQQQQHQLQHQACEDVPEWVDSHGHDCRWYSTGTRCTDFGREIFHVSNDHYAGTACCVCGGGQAPEQAAPLCCRDYTAKCLACAEGVSEGDYCLHHAEAHGCPTGTGTLPLPSLSSLPSPSPDCCKDWTAECLACTEGVSEYSYCLVHAETQGCPKETGTLPSPSLIQAPSSLPSRHPLCCRDFTAKCLACAAGVSEYDYCLDHAVTQGCPKETQLARP